MNTPPSHHRERGQTILLVAVSLVAILGLSALAIDVVTLYVSRAEAQRSADAAALAGAQMLVTLGVTADPCNAALQNAAIPIAKTQAQAVAQKNLIGGAVAQTINPTFPNQSSIGTCPGAFGINPQVSVFVQRTGLPTFFSRIWGAALGSVSATATAEAYNPSSAGSVSTSGTVVPIEPRCPKPILLPNCDPNPHPVVPGGSPCKASLPPFIDATSGAILNPGQWPNGVIGETFNLTAACSQPGSPCVPPTGPTPTAGSYYPLGLPSGALYLCPGCSGLTGGFQQDFECCNASTLKCGGQATVDDTTNPNSPGGAAATGGQCLIHQNPNTGQDTLIQEFPAIFQAGGNNPFVGISVQKNDQIMTSDSVVSIPIYDGLTVPQDKNSVTVIGYLQMFINNVDNLGNINATVLNVSGCGTSLNTSVPAIQGAATSVPVRLIQAP